MIRRLPCARLQGLCRVDRPAEVARSLRAVSWMRSESALRTPRDAWGVREGPRSRWRATRGSSTRSAPLHSDSFPPRCSRSGSERRPRSTDTGEAKTTRTQCSADLGRLSPASTQGRLDGTARVRSSPTITLGEPPILGRAAVRAFAGGRLPSVPSKRFGRDTVSMRCANLSHVVLIDGVAPHVRERPRSTAGGRRHRGRSAPSAAVWPTAPALLLLCVQPDVNLANAGAAGPVGGACVLHRQGRGAAVAASVGVIPGVPLQNSWSRRSRRSRLLRLGDCERLRNCRLC